MKSTSPLKRAIACFVIAMSLAAGTRILAFINAGMWYSPTATADRYSYSNSVDPDLSRCLPQETKFSNAEEANAFASTVKDRDVTVLYSDSPQGYIVVMTKPDSQCGWLDDFRANAYSWFLGFVGSAALLLCLAFMIHIIRFNRPGVYDGWRDLPEKPSEKQRQILATREKSELIEEEKRLLAAEIRRDEVATKAAVAHLTRLQAEAQVRDLNDGRWPTFGDRP